MSVLLPNASLSVRRVTDSTARNAHGQRVRGELEPVGEFHPGRTNERADGGWALGVDPALWPVRQGDVVVADDGREWLVRTADLIQNNYDPTVDWVRVDAAQRQPEGTEPGGPQFAGR